jgi:hypothetical protein
MLENILKKINKNKEFFIISKIFQYIETKQIINTESIYNNIINIITAFNNHI